MKSDNQFKVLQRLWPHLLGSFTSMSSLTSVSQATACLLITSHSLDFLKYPSNPSPPKKDLPQNHDLILQQYSLSYLRAAHLDLASCQSLWIEASI